MFAAQNERQLLLSIVRADPTRPLESARGLLLAPAMACTAVGGVASVLAIGTALPRHRYRQQELAELAQSLLPPTGGQGRLLERFFRRVDVQYRHLALDKEAYLNLGGFEQRSRAWLEVALDLGQRCVEEVLDGTGARADQIGQLMTTTVTGMCVPTLDARLMNLIPFRRDLKRVPLFGLGCVGGAAGVARLSDYLRAYPDQAAILLSVELCSLTLQCDDMSVANLISMGLFGDGAAAVLMVGADHPAAKGASPSVLDVASVFFPKTERTMGWDIMDTGFKVVLDSNVPSLARENLRGPIDRMLRSHGLSRSDIQTWVCHAGGPKIMDAVAEGLELEAEALAPAREALATIGNLSSASVLFLLEEYRRTRRPAPGSYGILMAMGPAFCAEIVLLQW